MKNTLLKVLGHARRFNCSSSKFAEAVLCFPRYDVHSASQRQCYHRNERHLSSFGCRDFPTEFKPKTLDNVSNFWLHQLRRNLVLQRTSQYPLPNSLEVKENEAIKPRSFSSRPIRGEGMVRVYIQSPGIIADPYQPDRPKVSFLKRFFTWTGWKQTRVDILEYVKTAYAIAMLRRHNRGFKKSVFLEDIASVYEKINRGVAQNDRSLLRQFVTDTILSVMKREIKAREEAGVHRMKWQLVGPISSIALLQGRLIGIDPKDTKRAFVQMTVLVKSKQKCVALDKKGNIIGGGSEEEVAIEDLWVFERPLVGGVGISWRLCGRIGR